MRSVWSRLSDASTPAAMLFAERPLPSAPGAAPTLVMSTIWLRRAGERFSQLPMMVSDSPPLLPCTQREYTSAVSMALRPESTKRSSRRKAVGSSTVQPKTLPPKTSGAMRRPERPRGRRFIRPLSENGAPAERRDALAQRISRHPHAIDGACELPRTAVAVEGGEADPGAAEAHADHRERLARALAGGGELLVALLDAQREGLSGKI